MASQYLKDVSKYIASTDVSEISRYLIMTKGIKPLVCLGLNPSVADKHISDRTIRRVERYAEINGYDSIAMINLYPLRSTDPKKLPLNKDEKIYNKNLEVIKELIDDLVDKTILLAPGKDLASRSYLVEALKELISFGEEIGIQWLCAGTTKENFPRHPSRGYYRDLEKYNPNQLIDKFTNK